MCVTVSDAMEILALAGSGEEDFLEWANGTTALLLWLDNIGLWKHRASFLQAAEQALLAGKHAPLQVVKCS